MSAVGLTPDAVDRVASWLRQRPAPSARMSALGDAFERHAQAALALVQHQNEWDQAEAAAREAAALGCLLALVREAWGMDMSAIAVARDGGRWEVWARGSDDGPFAWGNTEAEALLSALESAP